MSTNSRDATSGKCFSGVLRRLLCAGSLQTHPSDNYLSELDKIDFNQPNKALKTEANETQLPAATPGIVARLMGLDSMPDINWVPKRPTLDSIMRSRSVNSVDYLSQLDPKRQSLHRRVRTSVSFREVPTFLHRQDPDLFVICFDKVDEIGTIGEMGMREMKEKKAEKSKSQRDFRERNVVKKRENQENGKKRKGNSKRVDNVMIHKKEICRKPSGNLKGKSKLKDVNHKEVCVGLKYTKQRKKAECDCKSVNSVASTSGPKKLMSRKKSPMKVENFNKPCPDFVRKWNVDNQELRGIDKKVNKRLTTDVESESDYYMKMLVRVFRLTEEDTKGSNWPFIHRQVFELEEICVKFGEEILQLLVNQIVDELCEASR